MCKEVNKELLTTSYADMIWNLNLYMSNQICYLPCQHMQRQYGSLYFTSSDCYYL